jgi:putative transposase
MPWQEESLMKLRESLVADYESGAWTATELAALYQISRKTLYKWVARYADGGRADLADRSRRPQHSPQATPDGVRAAVCAARAAKPWWSPAQVQAWLQRQHPDVVWPSRVTIAKIWRAAHLYPAPIARPRRWCVRVPPARPTSANAMWTVDFKGDFRLGDGTRCYPLTVRDLASRFTLRCTALATTDRRHTQREMERAFAEYGLPLCIRSDNGEPFAGLGLGGLSQLNVTWLRLGIQLDHIDPGRPDQNGSHEQFHRVFKAETTRPPEQTLRAQQRRFDVFCTDYNYERPHAALAMHVPAERYTPSPRRWPGRVPPVEYPGHWETRRVQANGRIHWHGRWVFLSRALADEWVGLEEIDDGLWTIYFAAMPLARWLTATSELRPIVRQRESTICHPCHFQLL